MPIPKRIYTAEDYWKLPEGQRAELIDGQLYAMAPPSRLHQKISGRLYAAIFNYISEHHGNCEVYAAPFAVNLDATNQDWVEPDISVICDRRKLTDRGCSGAPDLIIEIVSPASKKTDYGIKSALYINAGVREYWVVDPTRGCTVVYLSKEEGGPTTIVPFTTPLTVGIYGDLEITIADYL